jgi:hypothetical protein
MTHSTTPARWPLFDLLSQWTHGCAAPGDSYRDNDFLNSSNKEAQHIRAHLRASPQDLRWLAGRDPGHSGLLPHMLRAAGINEHGLPPETHAAMAGTCGACQSKPRCAEELAQGHAGESCGAFCPNAQRINALHGT